MRFFLGGGGLTYRTPHKQTWVRCGALGWGTALQAGRSGVRFQMILRSIQPLIEMSTRSQSRQRRLERRADSLVTFVQRLSGNSWSLNLQRPKGPVQACKGSVLPSTVACTEYVPSKCKIQIFTHKFGTRCRLMRLIDGWQTLHCNRKFNRVQLQQAYRHKHEAATSCVAV